MIEDNLCLNQIIHLSTQNTQTRKELKVFVPKKERAKINVDREEHQSKCQPLRDSGGFS